MKRYAEDYDYIKDMGMAAWREMKEEERKNQDLVDGFRYDDTIYDDGRIIQPSTGEVFKFDSRAYDPDYAPCFQGETHWTSEDYRGQSLGIPMIEPSKKTIQQFSLLGLQFAANAFRAKSSIPVLNGLLVPTPKYKGVYPAGKMSTISMGGTYLKHSSNSYTKQSKKLLKKYKGIPDWAEGLEDGVLKGTLVIAPSEDPKKLCFEAKPGAEELLSLYFKVQKKGRVLILDKKPVEYEIFQEENWTKRTISTDNQEKLDILAIANDRLRPDHNKDFIEDCMKRLGEGERLTDDDLKRIRAIMYRIGMKPQTNSFRQASRRMAQFDRLGFEDDYEPDYDWVESYRKELDPDDALHSLKEELGRGIKVLGMNEMKHFIEFAVDERNGISIYRVNGIGVVTKGIIKDWKRV